MSLLRAGLWLSAGVSLGRVAGFIREAIIARTYGIGAESDLAVAVLTLPDTVLNILVGSAMGAALIPALGVVRQREGQPGVDRLHAQVAVLAVTLGVGLTMALTWAGPLLVRLLYPTMGPVSVERCAELIGIALWAIPLTVLSSVVGAGLQERERFSSTSLGTLSFNGAIILALLLWQGVLAGIAWATVAGAALRVAGQLGEWRLSGGGWRWGQWLPERAMAIAYGEVLLAGAALMVLPQAGRTLASFTGEGGITAYTWASKLFELPLQVLVTVFAMALFPRFTRLLAAGEGLEARRFLALGTQVVLVVAVVAAVVGGWFAPDLIAVAFKLDDERITIMARWLLPGLPLAGMTALLQAWYAAERDTRTPLIVGVIGVVVYVLAGWPVLHIWGLAGIAALATAQQAVVVGLLLRRVRPSGWPWPALLAGVVALAVCALSPMVSGTILRLGLAIVAGLLAVGVGLACIPGLRAALKR